MDLQKVKGTGARGQITVNDVKKHGESPEPAARFVWTRTLLNSFGQIAFSPDGRLLAVVIETSGIRLWDVRTWEVTLRLDNPYGKDSLRFPLLGFAFSPDSRLLAIFRTHNGPPVVKLLDVRTGKLVQTLRDVSITGNILARVVNRSIRAEVFSPDGQTFAAVCADAKIRLWSLHTGELFQTITLAAQEKKIEWNSLTFSPDGRLVADHAPGVVRLWDSRTGRLLGTLDASSGIDDDYWWSMAFSLDGRLLAGVTSGAIILWDTKSGGRSGILTGEDVERGNKYWSEDESYFRMVAFSPDGRFLAANYLRADDAYEVGLWDVRTRNWVQTLSKVTAGKPLDLYHQEGLAFSPDGRFLALSEADYESNNDILILERKQDKE